MAANKWRIDLDKFLKDETKNIFGMKLAAQKGRNMEFSFLDDILKFSVELNSNANIVNVNATDSELKLWLKKMKEYLSKNPEATVGPFLEAATNAYNDEPATSTSVDDKKAQEAMFDDADDGDDDEEATPFTGIGTNGDPFDLPLESPSILKLRDEQQKKVAQYLDEQVNSTINTLKISDTIKTMSSAAIKGDAIKKKAEKELYVRFYTDGIFTIDNGPPQLMDDPKSKKYLEAFSKGFVPDDLSRGAKDIDLHVIWESFKHSEMQQVKQQKMLAQQDDEQSLIEDQIMEQIKQESIRMAQEQQQKNAAASSSTAAAPSNTKPTATTTAPNTQKPTTTTTAKTTGHTTGSTATKTSNPTTTSATTKFEYKCDMSKPHTPVQFKFPDGKKVVQQFNTTDTVQILYKFVTSCNNASVPGDFVLCTVHPRVEVTDMKANIESAKLENAQLIVSKK